MESGMAHPSSSSSCSWVVFLATFLTLSAMTLTSQGQPQVLLRTQPEPQYYVTKDQAANITCEAMGATSIAFMCLGAPALQRALTTYQSFDEARGAPIIRTTLKVRWAEVEAAVRGAGLEEEGGYWCQCTAQDEDRFISVSSRRTVVSLAVLEKKFQESPVSQIVASGSQTILTCTPPHGVPAPQVSWRKDGHKVKVSRDDNLVLGADDSLTIMDTRLEDGGTYQCVARNMAGRRQSPLATLIVEDVGDLEVPQRLTTRADKDTPRPRAPREVPEPVFLEQPPEDVYITPNLPLTVVCAVQGATRMTVRCNNQRIDPKRLRSQSDNATNFIRHEYTLTFAEVENYINTVAVQHYKCGCVAWYMDPSLPRKWGSVLSTEAKIHPSYLNEEFRAHPRDTTAQLGTTTRLRCVAPEGMPKPTVYWSFEGQRLDHEADSRYTLSEEGILTIAIVGYSDEGRYYCVAENTVGIRRSKVAAVRVSEDAVPEPTTPSSTPGSAAGAGGYVATFPPVIPDAPMFVKDLDSQYFLDWDGEAMLVCSVVSANMLTYRCMNNRLQENQQVIDEQEDRASGKTLLTASTIVTSEDVGSEAPGDYSCQCVAWYLKEGAWYHNFSSPATILPAYIDSVFIYEPRSGAFYAGDMVEFACNPPGGQPTPRVMWWKDGEELDPEADDNLEILDDGRLIIDRVTVADAGLYECVAFNPAGRRKSSPAELEVYPGADTTPKPGHMSTPDKHDKMMTSTPFTPVTPDEEEDFHLSTSKSGRIIPFFTNDPLTEVYVVGNEEAILTCGAVEATRLIFDCNGDRVPESKKRRAFNMVDPQTGYKILEKEIGISRRDMEQFQGPGPYICHCRAYYPGDDGESWSYVPAANTTVKIAYLETQFEKVPVSQVVELGVATELMCLPPMGVPSPMVHWQKDGYRLTETNNIRVSAEGSLEFDAVSMADTGDYTCIAENIIGVANSKPVRMTVVDIPVVEPEPEGEGEGTSEPTGEGDGEAEGGEGGVQGRVVPTFVMQPKSNYYIIRSNAVTITCLTVNAEQINFVCNDESIPQSRVQYEDMQVEGHGDVMAASIDISREEVENHNTQRGGNDYHCQCQARYSVPHASQYQYVTSTYGYVEVAYLKKMFAHESFNTTVEKGTFLSLPCEAPEGHPTPEVSWTKNGEAIRSDVYAPDDAFIINEVREADAGRYVCVATNVANTRKSRPSIIQIKVGDRIIKGDQSAGGAEPEGEPESTTADYEESWNTGKSKDQECFNRLQTCTALMPTDMSGCQNAPRYKACLERFQTECDDVINREAIEAAEGAKKRAEMRCAGGRVCEELMDCQSEYSKKKVPNADAETMSMAILCEGIHSFLRCAHRAAEKCKIPQEDPNTSLTALAEWFEIYCMKVVKQPWAKECPSLSQCDLPIEQTTILSNLVQASLWCPYVKKTMDCTWRAVSDCDVKDVEGDLNSLDNLAADTCPVPFPSMGEEEGDKDDQEKEDQEGEEDGKLPGELDISIERSEEGDGSGNTSTVRASILLTSLLPVLLVWMTSR